MVDQIIRPADLPNRANPVASEKIPVDNGVTVGGATIQSIVESGRPAASQSEAEAGVNSVKAMTPLTTDQKIEYEIGRSIASKAQGDLAVTAVQPGDLAAVATSGEYNDLSGLPTLGTAAAQDTGFFATSAQGALAESAVQSIVAGTNIVVDSTDARNPIISSIGVVDYTTLSGLLASYRRITFHDPSRTKIGQAMGVLPNGRIVVCYRSATTHNIAVSRMEAIYSDDGGLTWSAPVVVVETADHDYRNYAAGVTQDGVFIVATEDITVSTGGATGNRVRFYFSLDGVTFAERTGAASGAAATRIIPYGAMVHRENGSCYFRCYHMHANPAANADGDQSLFSSSDNFQTANFSIIWDGPGATGPFPTEPYTVALDENNHVSFIRRQKADDDTPLLMKSSDGGITWSAPAAITNIAMGQNPPCLWYDSDKEVLYAIWPSRGQTHLADGASWRIFPFFFSSISKAQLLAGGTVWRTQTPIALFSPPQAGSFPGKPGGDGDSGHPHVFEAHGMRFLLYYSGSHGALGSDLYVANLSTLIGI